MDQQSGSGQADYAVETSEGRTAGELEFSLKGTERLRRIVRGYLRAEAYDFVDFVVLDNDAGAAVKRLLTRLLDQEIAAETAAQIPGLPTHMPAIRIVAWRDPLSWLHAGVRPFPPLPAADPTDAEAVG